MQENEELYQEIREISERLSVVATKMEQADATPARMHGELMPKDLFDVELCADLFKALSNNDRLRILRSLGQDSSYFAQLSQLTGLDNSPLRFHLTVLKEVNLIAQERFRGKYMITKLGRQALAMASYFYMNMQKQEMHEHE